MGGVVLVEAEEDLASLQHRFCSMLRYLYWVWTGMNAQCVHVQ